jgi:hypothetical protein
MAQVHRSSAIVFRAHTWQPPGGALGTACRCCGCCRRRWHRVDGQGVQPRLSFAFSDV